MKLGFVSSILPDYSLEELLSYAAEAGFSCVEAQCWPKGKAERRYAGVTHVDVVGFDAAAASRTQALIEKTGVGFSGLGYYPNVLSADADEVELGVRHLIRVIDAAALLGVSVVNSFVGRDPKQTVDAQWPRFLEVWRPIVAHAESRGVRIAIENCPMFFTADEWPGGKNLATSPAIWRRMFADIPSKFFGLNYDPSHLVFQRIDHLKPLREFRDRLFHVHAKDVRVDRDKLDDCGVLAYPNKWHTPKLPGLGEIRWGEFLGVLAEVGYDGPVAVEVEDRAFEATVESRRRALAISRRHLLQFMQG